MKKYKHSPQSIRQRRTRADRRKYRARLAAGTIESSMEHNQLRLARKVRRLSRSRPAEANRIAALARVKEGATLALVSNLLRSAA